MKYFAVIFVAIFIFQHSVDAAVTEAPDDDDDWEDTSSGPSVSGGPQEADDDGRVYKNPRNSPSAVCPRDEEQATLLGQKCLRKCSSDEDCKSKKKKCLCDGACGMSCIKPDRECPELDKPELGDVTVSGRLFGDKAVYSCPHGFHVVGLQSRNCQADGQWAGQAPACKQNIYCLTPPHIEHARHSALPEQATFDLDATIQYHCHTGYVTNGFPRAKCLAIEGHASWYGPDITCEPRSCGPPGELPHGWVTAECHTFGCRAALHCGAGFELVGRAERFCQSDGTWAPNELPTCVLVTAVQCPTPDAPRHGRAIYTSCAYNSIVSYECKYGYRLVGDNTRRCGADKKWSGTQPVCKEINCGHPGRLYNGWLENIEAGTGLGASIIFRCHDGMTMEGNSSTVCQLDGTWRYPLPRCLAPCVVPHVTQGKVILVPSNITHDTNETAPSSAPTTQIIGSSTMVHHGDALIVECEKNYEFPSNTPAVTCNNGTWTQILKCQPARCKRLPKPPKNGMVIAPKTDHGMRARFHCKDGFALKGPEMLLCSFGNWTGEMPICQEVYCPFPGYIENGKVLLVGNMGLYDYRPYVKKVVNNKQIMYDCDKGYVLSEGPPGATCIGGHWSPKELPSCTPGQHPRLRWSRRRRSAEMSKRRYFRSKYLRKYYHHLRKRSLEITNHQNLLKNYELYENPGQISPKHVFQVNYDSNENSLLQPNNRIYNFDDMRNALGNHFRRKRQVENYVNKNSEWSQYNRLYRLLRKRSLDFRRPYYANSRKYQGYNFFGLRPRAKRDTRNRLLNRKYNSNVHLSHNVVNRNKDYIPMKHQKYDLVDILPLKDVENVRNKRFIDILPFEMQHNEHTVNKRFIDVLPLTEDSFKLNDAKNVRGKRFIDIWPFESQSKEHTINKRSIDILPLIDDSPKLSDVRSKRFIDILPFDGQHNDHLMNKRSIDVLPLNDDFISHNKMYVENLLHNGIFEDVYLFNKRSIDILPLNREEQNKHVVKKRSLDILPLTTKFTSHKIGKRHVDILPQNEDIGEDHFFHAEFIDILPIKDQHRRSIDILPLRDTSKNFIDILPLNSNGDRFQRKISVNNALVKDSHTLNKRSIDILPLTNDSSSHKIGKRSIDILPLTDDFISHKIGKRSIDILPLTDDFISHKIGKRSIDILPLMDDFISHKIGKRSIDILPLTDDFISHKIGKRSIDILPLVDEKHVNKRSIDILPFNIQSDPKMSLKKRSKNINGYQNNQEAAHSLSERNIDILPFLYKSNQNDVKGTKQIIDILPYSNLHDNNYSLQNSINKLQLHSVKKRFIDILPLTNDKQDKKVTKRNVNGMRNSYLAKKYEEMKIQWEEEMKIQKNYRAIKLTKKGNFQENPPLKVDPKGDRKTDKNRGKFKDLPKVSSEEMIKRMKRTSRKTERLNQTTASVPKSNKDKNRQAAPSPGTPYSGVTTASFVDTDGNTGGNGEERGKGRGRVKGPCDPISSEPYVNVEVVKYGRDPNITYSSGTIVRVACGKGYGLNLGYNSTAKCVRGRWKPMKPICEILPCHIPVTENGIFTLSATEGGQVDTETPLNETMDIENGQVVQFACEPGYNVQGASNLRCWHGDWAVTSMPECVPSPCELPVVAHGIYASGYRPGLTTAHGSAVTLHCERGYAPPAVLQCSLGDIRVRPPEPCQSIEGNISSIREGQDFRGGSDIVSEDFDELEYPTSASSTECGPPASLKGSQSYSNAKPWVQGTLIYRDGASASSSNTPQRYPHGTEVTFRCIAAIMGERSTWKILCDKGKWVGKSVSCEEEDLIPAGLLTNATCTFRNNEANVVSFYNDLEIKEEVVEFPAGAVLVSRCVDIGKYAMIGPNQRKCMGGEWDGSKPSCFGLNQENDYAMEKPPTILFRHQLGPIMQSNDGKLIVYPGTILHMECLWMRKFGNPKWNVSHEYRKYPEGWSSDPGRDSYLEFRLSIFHAVQDDSGIFTCITPARQSHQVEIIVEAVHCPPLPMRRGLISSSQSTKMGSEVSFSCANGNSLIGAAKITCLPSGNWSAPLPLCESVECGEVVVGSSGPPNSRPRVSIVSRGVGGRAAFSCPSGWGLRGPTETVCSPSGEWTPAPPICVEVSCPPPAAPVNGYLLGKAPFRAGDVVQFNCNPAHMMQGQPIVACQDNARWSGETPKCIQACSYPGTTISGRMSSVKFYYKIGETISFTCEPGLILRGAPMLRCLRNGKWSNAIPICSRESSSNETFISGNDSDQLLNDAPILSSEHTTTTNTTNATATSSTVTVVDHKAPTPLSLNRNKSDTVMMSFAGVTSGVSYALPRPTQPGTTKRPRPKLTKSKTYFQFNPNLLASLTTLPTIMEIDTHKTPLSTAQDEDNITKITHPHVESINKVTKTIKDESSTVLATLSTVGTTETVTQSTSNDNTVSHSSTNNAEQTTQTQMSTVDKFTYTTAETIDMITETSTQSAEEVTDESVYTNMEKVTPVTSVETSSAPLESSTLFTKIITRPTPFLIDDWYSTANNYYFTPTSITHLAKIQIQTTTQKPVIKNCIEVEDKGKNVGEDSNENSNGDALKVNAKKPPSVVMENLKMPPTTVSPMEKIENNNLNVSRMELKIPENNISKQEYKQHNVTTQPTPPEVSKDKKKVSLDLISLFQEIDKLENKNNSTMFGTGTSKKKDLSHIQQATNAEIEHIKKQLGIESNSKRKMRNR